MNSFTNTIINPKSCDHNCGIRIYWNTSENAYFEVFTNKKHSCPNRSKSITQTAAKANTNPITTRNNPTYYYLHNLL